MYSGCLIFLELLVWCGTNHTCIITSHEEPVMRSLPGINHNNTKTIEVMDIYPGCNIYNALDEMVKICAREKTDCVAIFNGICMYVKPDSEVSKLYKIYDALSDAMCNLEKSLKPGE
jgi:hypothetical protein